MSGNAKFACIRFLDKKNGKFVRSNRLHKNQEQQKIIGIL